MLNTVFYSGLAIPEFLVSKPAILISVFVILAAIIVLAIALMVKETTRFNSNAINTAMQLTASQQSKPEEKVEEEPTERFCMLSEIERRKETYRTGGYDESLTLDVVCENFRNYAASKLKLYYDIADIRRFISGLAVSHIIILQGMSGTGKTSLAHAFGSFIDNSSTIIPVQPMWKERTDLVGY